VLAYNALESLQLGVTRSGRPHVRGQRPPPPQVKGVTTPVAVGIPDAHVCRMAVPRDPNDTREESWRLIAVSRQLAERTRAQLETAHERVERARNVLQAIWLRRALRARHRR